MPALSAPQPLAEEHQIEHFRNKHASLESWLKEHARHNQKRGGSVCYVVCAPGNVVVGYYAVAMGSILHAEAPRKMRHDMPKPIPVLVLGRLAVDSSWEGKGIGSGMLADALNRVQSLSKQAGCVAMLCHAIDEEAKAFYRKYGFVESPLHPLTLLLPVRAMVASLK